MTDLNHARRRTLAAVFVAWVATFVMLPPALAQTGYPEPANFQTVFAVFLLRGPNAAQGTPEERAARQKAHIGHLTALGEAGHSKIAGPFGGDQDLRGIVLLTVRSKDEARSLAEADPAVVAGALRVEILTMTVPANWFTLGPLPPNFRMRQHVLAFLDTPDTPPAEPAALAALQQGHLAHLFALREQGRLAYAGPFTDGGRRRGMAVFLSESVDDVRAWMAVDPLVKAGQLVLVPFAWYAADGIMTPVR